MSAPKHINPNNAPATVLIKKTSNKATPMSNPDRFANALTAAGGNLIGGVETAASFLPGGGALSAAIRGAGGGTSFGYAGAVPVGLGGSNAGMAMAASSNSYGYATTDTLVGKSNVTPTTLSNKANGAGYTPDGASNGVPTPNVSGDPNDPLYQLQEGAFALLQQQIQVQKVSNYYTGLSNVMKSDHETRRGVIRNMA